MKSLLFFQQLVRFQELLFSLPFALTAALLCLPSWSFSAAFFFQKLLKITLAIFLARTAGMSFNRLIDCSIDAKNPRTKHRLLPSGRLSQKKVLFLGVLSSILFFFISLSLHPLYFYVSPLLILLMIFYSFCKRFTCWGHLVLAFLHFLSPLSVSFLFQEKLTLSSFFLSLAVFCWIFGVDLIYQMQDLHYDRKHHLWNFPVLLGERNTRMLALFFHVWMLVFFCLCGWFQPLNLIYYLGPFLLVILFAKQYYRLFFSFKIGEEKNFFLFQKKVALIIMLSTLGSVLWPVLL